MSRWKPRASQIGHYMSCSYRAAFDRAYHEQLLDLSPEDLAQVEEAKKSSPYADLGTCIHFHLQDGIRAKFPPGDHAPTVEQRLNASTLFKGNLETLDTVVRNAAIMASKHLPALDQGVGWLAEAEVKTKVFTGHIDLLSEDYKWLVDLKTTSKPPVGRLKPAHFAQTLTYHYAVEEGLGIIVPWIRVLYVDSVGGGSWAVPVDVEVTNEVREFREKVIGFAAMLRTATLWKVAVPSIGGACEEWCPYTHVCRDKYLPAGGKMVAALPAKAMKPV